MKEKSKSALVWTISVCVAIMVVYSLQFTIFVVSADQQNTRTITDSYGREVSIPEHPNHVVCSGAGALRYLTYLNKEDTIAGIDAMDAGSPIGKPYAMANPQFSSYPIIGDFKGEGHGSDNLEALINLSPDLIIKTYDTRENIEEEQEKLGIPIVYLDYGDLGENRETMYNSLRILGNVMGASERAEDVIKFFDTQISDLNSRTSNQNTMNDPSTYIGGINYYQSLGMESTEPAYPPFILIHAHNVAKDTGIDHAMVSKEQIIDWDPAFLFIDVGGSALEDLKKDKELYQNLAAVQNKNIYGVLPYNFFTTNQDTVLADAYYIGKVLYPNSFVDIEPAVKADEIFTYLVGKPVFSELNNQFNSTAFSQISLSSLNT